MRVRRDQDCLLRSSMLLRRDGVHRSCCRCRSRVGTSGGMSAVKMLQMGNVGVGESFPLGDVNTSRPAPIVLALERSVSTAARTVRVYLFSPERRDGFIVLEITSKDGNRWK